MASDNRPRSRDNDPNQAIQVLERRDIDLLRADELAAYVARSSSPAQGPQFAFLRIKAISRTLPEKKSDVERYLMEDILSGLHGLRSPFIYLIIGSKLSVSVYLGISDKSALGSSPYFLDVLADSLRSTFPNIEVEFLSKDGIDTRITGFFHVCKHWGIMTGLPTAKLGVEEHGIEQIERLLRGLYRQEFGYMVVADPVDDVDVVDAFDGVAQTISATSPLVKGSKQYVSTTRITLTDESINRPVQHYVELLEILLERLKLGKSQGMWRTMCYFFSPHSATTGKMSNLLKTVFSGDKSVPEAIRTLVLDNSDPSPILRMFRQLELKLDFPPAFAAEHPLEGIIKHKLATVLTSRDLATLTHLPKEEMPGYDVKDTARFGVCVPDGKPGNTLVVGEIMDRGLGTGNCFGILPGELTKHGLIVGVTGSGKSNTCLNFLDQLWKAWGTPFLVIEPAKSEYRSLLNVQGYEGLQVFTLGDEITSPFRLNPFEILDGVKLQTHIDNLRAVFNASFIMYAPMPYVLERCIHEIYEDKGWDLTTNQNRFTGAAILNHYEIFPTLTDLYEKIDSVVNEMGYEDRLTMDIKAGLQARVGSLRIGGKGAMLDTAMSVPTDVLLGKPTILELQSIGDDEEKSFIIGLLIARLYEYREVESKRTRNIAGLRHVTLLEEAHRLLARTSTDFSNLENVNTKAKAVETFCNILSEIRAFGEGILVAEQIPSKLAQDAVKNTNLKVMHRIVAKDDRDLIGGTMNLNENQNRFVSIMETGQAVVFSEGCSEPFLVRVSHYPSSVKMVNPTKSFVDDKDVTRHMANSITALDRILGKQEGCKQCKNKCVYRDASNLLLSGRYAMQWYVVYLLGIVERSDCLVSQYQVFRDNVLGSVKASLKGAEEIDNLMFCFLITAGARFLRDKARKYDLPQDILSQLLGAYNNLMNSYFRTSAKTLLSVHTEVQLKEFQRLYIKSLSVDKGPFPGCNEFCGLKCLFRYDVEPRLLDRTLDDDILRAINSRENSRDNVRRLCLDVADRLASNNSIEFKENIALCFFIQKSVQWSVQEVISNVKTWFLPSSEGGAS